MASRSSPRGLVRMLLLMALLLLLAGGAGWWWFYGRFALPDAPPGRFDEPRAVLDYAGRRDLGRDPYQEMVRPDPASARHAGIDARMYFARWEAAYVAATAARTLWKGATGVSAVIDAEAARRSADKAQLEYLYQAQVAEYWRARYLAAGGS